MLSAIYEPCWLHKSVFHDTINTMNMQEVHKLQEFIYTNPFLVDLAKEASDRIKMIYGESCDILLELIDEQLYLIILTNLGTKEIIPLQEKLDKDWWLNNTRRGRGKFNIVVEHVF